MKQRPRIYYSDAQKESIWDRWQKGDSMRTIAGLFDRGHASVQRILAETGGIRPPPRSRSKLSLTLAEREEISRGLVTGHSIRSIATSLGRAASRAPDSSCPGTCGRAISGSCPIQPCQSLRHKPSVKTSIYLHQKG